MGAGGFNAQNPRIMRMVTNAPLATVTTAGFYNQSSSNAVNALLPTDTVEIAYAQGTNSATTALFSVSIVSWSGYPIIG